MTTLAPDPPDDILREIAFHVSLPPRLPQEAPGKERAAAVESAICSLLATAARRYRSVLPEPREETRVWKRMERMFDVLGEMVSKQLDPRSVAASLLSMKAQDVRAFHIREQNASVIVRRQAFSAVFEVFEVQPSNEDVLACTGKLVRLFPGHAVEIPLETFVDPSFINEVASFLCKMDVEILDSVATTKKGGSHHHEVRDSADPHYVSRLFIGILLGYGRNAEIIRVRKRTEDVVLWKDAYRPWRRSPVWLIARVALHTSLPSPLDYKGFMVYFHGSLLALLVERGFDSDLLFAARAKMARRLDKLAQSDEPSFLLEHAHQTARTTQELLQRRMRDIEEEQRRLPSWAPHTLKPSRDAVLSLRSSQKYLRQKLSRAPIRPRPPPPFTPPSLVRLISTDLEVYANDQLKEEIERSGVIALADFERAVRDHADSWMERFLFNADLRVSACEILVSCLVQYEAASKVHYLHDRLDQSTAVLTMIELWAAIDRIAVQHCPMLAEYSPELPTNFLEPLLLRSHEDIARASIIEAQLRFRNEACTRGSVFTSDTFATRSYSQSAPLKALKQRIEIAAQARRDTKIAELSEMNSRYRQLETQAAGIEHEDVWVPSKGRYSHKQKRCPRCIVERQMNMTIAIHEWPLPANQSQAQVVVFELMCPPVFAIWRSATYMLVSSLGLPERQHLHPEVYAQLHNHPDLATFGTFHPGSRISLASSTKSFARSHYANKTIPARQDAVCVASAMQYQLYDVTHDTWASGPFTGTNVSKDGTLELATDSPYRYLQYSVTGTSHSTNRVLAEQSECPISMTVHEHMAFGSLRSGPLLQWLNILRELHGGSLTLNREEVHTLISQAAWQIGPSLVSAGAYSHRAWHVDLQDQEFGLRLSESCIQILRGVQDNWTESGSVRVLVTLALRLFGDNEDCTVRQRLTDFLRQARAVTLSWLRKLKDILARNIDDEKNAYYQGLVLEMAAICRMTYDLDRVDVTCLLCTAEDASTLVECAVALNENQPSTLDHAPPHLRELICRDRRLAHKLETPLHDLLLRFRSGFDSALSSIWPDYRAGTSAREQNSWIYTRTLADTDGAAQVVHYNLYDGTLLVDGKPLGRLPRSISSHETYVRTFGQSLFDVIPADVPGMQYATRLQAFGGHQFMFALDGTELRIQARTVTTRSGVSVVTRFELIAHEKLRGDLPTLLVDEYAHWLNLSSGRLAFRPLHDQWSPSSDHWGLHVTGDLANQMTRAQSTQARTSLVETSSPTFRMISARLERLEDPQYMHITHAPDGARPLMVELPRMRLNFYVDDGALRSGSLRDMIVDDDQYVGTFLGLSSQLILRSIHDSRWTLSRSRCVLVPHGQLQVDRLAHHVRVSIDTSTQRQVTYSKYDVDEVLGRLTGDTNLRSRLFKTLLHAVTGHCLPDSLTGQTGVEQALYELSAGGTQSFQRLSPPEVDLLSQIGALSPQRVFYPPHKRCMETVHWSSICAYSQHAAFAPVVRDILAYARRLQVFDEGSDSEIDWDATYDNLEREPTLHLRAAVRMSQYFPPGMVLRRGVPHYLPDWRNDAVYTRDLDSQPHEFTRAAAWASTLSRSGNQQVAVALTPTILGYASLEGPDTGDQALQLGYDSAWLAVTTQSSWLTMFELFRRERAPCSHRATFSAGTLAYNAPTELRDLLPVLLAGAASPALRRFAPPTCSSYSLSDGMDVSRARVRQFILSSVLPLSKTPSEDLTKRSNETQITFYQRQRDHHTTYSQSFASSLENHVMSTNWPTNRLRAPTGEHSRWLDVNRCMADVQAYFISCENNRTLRHHLQSVENAAAAGLATVQHIFFSDFENYGVVGHAASKLRSVDNIWASRAQRIGDKLDHMTAVLSRVRSARLAARPTPPVLNSRTTSARPDTSALGLLVDDLRGDDSDRIRTSYARDLRQSLIALEQCAEAPVARAARPSPDFASSAQTFRDDCRDACQGILARIRVVCMPHASVVSSETVLEVSGLWPRITPLIVLARLTLSHRLAAELTNVPVGQGMKDYCHALIDYQQSERLLRYAVQERTEDVRREHENWSCRHSKDVDHLLLQIDGDFKARNIQLRVAEEMISPRSGQSTVSQLNMGEGKSSVIVPMVVSTLATGGTLVRVVVLKALAAQMFRLLVNRLGSLADRKTFYLPFSRQVKMDSEHVHTLVGLFKDCAAQGGILLAQPEHILSLKLMTIDTRIERPGMTSWSGGDGFSMADELGDLRQWLDQTARDVLDESDELLHVQYQLVYTSGQRAPLEDSPDRWTTMKAVLALLAKHAPALKDEYPDAIDVQSRGPGRFPSVRFLQAPQAGQVETRLKELIAEDALRGEVPSLNLEFISRPADREVVRRFLSTRDLGTGPSGNVYYDRARQLLSGCWKAALLLRGLLAWDVLTHILREKRYRVNFGVDPRRTLKLAVPYVAKDIPSLRSEFSHADVTIGLTYLSYYAAGLNEEELRACFHALSQADGPELEYQAWVACDNDLPIQLRQLNGVNLKDVTHFRNSVIPALSGNRAAIAFYLSSVVFPLQAKEFPHKLATSGWDLAEKKGLCVTGFSGTNDRRYLLPSSIEQRDPVQQSSTNALVMSYLLQRENNHYQPMVDHAGKPLTTKEFLQQVVSQSPPIRVLLDVGAQMLELQNQELVAFWLSLRPSRVSAAIFFNDRDELAVLSADGTIELLESSPFRDQMDRCLVYLDDAHTRGTDLKLPLGTRAAVTLGPKVTKDRLVQGCMRLRQLGQGQSVMFFAPLECDVRIRASRPAADVTSRIQARDILRWVMQETCDDIRHYVPHWVQQGLDHHRRYAADVAYARFRNVQDLRNAWQVPEARTLEDLYGQQGPVSGLMRQALAVPAMRTQLSDLGITELEDPRVDEEAEREVTHEAERERQVQRPPKSIPLEPVLDADVLRFVKGNLRLAESPAFRSLFHPIVRMGQPNMWSPSIFATADFTRTVHGTTGNELSAYMRPMHWIVSAEGPDGLLLVAMSPYEINLFLPTIRKSRSVRLHMYAARTVQSMRSFSDLRFHVIPRLPDGWNAPSLGEQSQLSLWAGQLFFDEYRAYFEFCAFLGIFSPESTRLYGHKHLPRGADGYIEPEHRVLNLEPALTVALADFGDRSFYMDQVEVLKRLISLRRNGMDFMKTHVGQLLHGRQLTENDF